MDINAQPIFRSIRTGLPASRPEIAPTEGHPRFYVVRAAPESWPTPLADIEAAQAEATRRAAEAPGTTFVILETRLALRLEAEALH